MPRRSGVECPVFPFFTPAVDLAPDWRDYYDYRANVDAYPKWQAWLQNTQPKLLVVWGKHDLSFDPGEPERYRKDVPKAEVHVLDAGHFALDTKADEIAELVRDFMKTQK